jgi:hypothetical protein
VDLSLLLGAAAHEQELGREGRRRRRRGGGAAGVDRGRRVGVRAFFLDRQVVHVRAAAVGGGERALAGGVRPVSRLLRCGGLVFKSVRVSMASARPKAIEEDWYRAV